MTDEQKNTDEQLDEAETPKPAKKPRAKKAAAKAKPAAKANAAANEETADTQTTSSSGTGEATDAKPAKKPRAKKAAPKAKAAAAEATTDEAEAAEATEEAVEEEPAAKPRAKKAAAKPAKPARTAPARRRDRQREAPGGVEVRAQAKYVRTSARKARLVCDHIRGKDVAQARAILAFTPRAAAKDWAKLLESAVANAEHNHELVGEDLKITAVYADEGPTLKRYRPRAMGRATRIRKRTSHLTITLTPKEL
jgi:ribosomal protein L22